MVGAVSGIRFYGSNAWVSRVHPVGVERTQAASVSRPAEGQNPPIEPVRSLTPVSSQQTQLTRGEMPPIREGADPAEMAVRMRMKYVDSAEEGEPVSGGEKTKSPREILEEETCQTCERRKYQDGSDDPGVSFKTAAHIDADASAAVVRGHEQEHVVREQAAAERDGREVVQQSVTLHNAICPECGEVYTSGGTTRTTTAEVQDPAQQSVEEQKQKGASFEAVA